jgi:hypothetical protein
VIEETRRLAESRTAKPAVRPGPAPVSGALPPAVSSAAPTPRAATDGADAARLGELRTEIDRLRARLGEAEAGEARERRAR